MTFNISQSQKTLDLSFSATLENIDKAAEETKRFLASVNADRHTFDVVLVLREALANAVVDGSRLDATKIIAYTLRLDDNNLIMEIEDEGGGFDWQNHFGKKAPANAESGRGLAIMEAYCEEVVFNDKGNRLLLKKTIKLGDGVQPEPTS